MVHGFRNYLTLCKPRVVLLMLLTAWAGMYLASNGPLPLSLWVTATIGIGLMSTASATFNHIIDQRVDAIMDRTKKRPLVLGQITVKNALIFAITQALCGFFVLYYCVNATTAYLTLLAAIGYAGIYSLFLKRATSQNIVIGGLAGALPPLMGWTAVTGRLDAQGWLLVLIIFAWTPAHFWALCIHRFKEYKNAEIPMLPVTHGIAFTKLHITLYTFLTLASSLLPYAIGMSGELYLVCAILLGLGFLGYAFKLQFTQDQTIALKTFHYSLIYLTGIFLVLLLDHHLLNT